jgi:hypothetical protein
MIRPIAQRTIFALLLALGLLAGGRSALAVIDESYVSLHAAENHFELAASGRVAPLVVSPDDHPGVLRVVNHLQADVERVTGSEPPIVAGEAPEIDSCVLIGTLGKSPLIDQLIAAEKLDVADIAGRWDTYVLQVIDDPLPGVKQALVICGSNKRGTIYGMYDLAAQIGVSPWYWWADVPVPKQDSLYVFPGRHTPGEPAVKYRGIFINDEAPALAGWAQEKFGGCNHQFYDRVYELILRLKGNYLWPAMWGRAIYDDDPESPRLADEYGLVIGTTHHEPMMRAHVEWERCGSGPWNYEKNESKLREFWRDGIRRMGTYESIVSVGMRGDGDMPMTEKANITLLERIVADQRKIIEEVTGKKPSEVPQLWALYKEVQEYYDKGMRVPDDVTLLLCDDNWGNLRKLPQPGDKPRAGGYGIYYHYDYVGGPRNYKWLNTNQISRVWEQMHLAYEHGVDRIWIVNVGDIKPMEFPIEFFLDYAWNPHRWPAERLPEYTRRWAAAQFGERYAAEIADILTTYTRYNSRRKPELLAPNTYSLVNYREAETIVNDYNALAAKAERIGKALPAEFQDAYYQLVLFPVKACANLNELYVAAGTNRLYAKQRRAATNDEADRVRELFAKDAELTRRYNEVMAGGKWNHMMDQTHIGYTNWQEPPQNNLPEIVEIELPAVAELGVAVEGSENSWTGDESEPLLPVLSRFGEQSRYIDVFNRGAAAFDFAAESPEAWLALTPSQGRIDKQQRIEVSVDWRHAPSGARRVPITITGPERNQVIVFANVENRDAAELPLADCFVESDGYVSIEAEHFNRAVDAPPIRWRRIPDFGRTLSGVTPFPVTVASHEPGDDSPRLEYRVYLSSTGDVKVHAYVSPTLNYHNTEGLRYAVSFDDQPPQIVNIHAGESLQVWERWVANNINETVSEHLLDEAGPHVLKFWMVDPGVVLQRIVVATGDVRPSYLGPPESIFQPIHAAASPPIESSISANTK